jgi:hypothetical protein
VHMATTTATAAPPLSVAQVKVGELLGLCLFFLVFCRPTVMRKDHGGVVCWRFFVVYLELES